MGSQASTQLPAPRFRRRLAPPAVALLVASIALAFLVAVIVPRQHTQHRLGEAKERMANRASMMAWVGASDIWRSNGTHAVDVLNGLAAGGLSDEDVAAYDPQGKLFAASSSGEWPADIRELFPSGRVPRVDQRGSVNIEGALFIWEPARGIQGELLGTILLRSSRVGQPVGTHWLPLGLRLSGLAILLGGIWLSRPLNRGCRRPNREAIGAVREKLGRIPGLELPGLGDGDPRVMSEALALLAGRVEALVDEADARRQALEQRAASSTEELDRAHKSLETARARISQLEGDLRQTMALYRAFFNQSPVSLALVDAKGRVVHVNNHHLANQVRGRAREEITGLDLTDGEKARQAGFVALPPSLLEGMPFLARETTLRLDDGRERHVRVRAVPLSDEKGESLQGAVIIQEDVTETREAYQGLSLCAPVGLLARAVAHELNGVLGGMKGHAQLAQEEGSSEAARRALAVVLELCERGAGLAQDLTRFSRMGEMEWQECSVTQAVEMALSMVAGELERREISVRRDFQPAPPVWMDVRQLSKAFLNLIIESCESLPVGGKVSLTVCSRGGHDEPRESAAQVLISTGGFETAKGGGEKKLRFLATVAIFTNHGGEVGIEVDGDGESRFVVTLPAASAPASAEEEPVSASADRPAERRPTSDSLSVALVEDDEIILDLLGRKLRAMGMDVRTFDCGRDALDAVRREPCDVLVSDIVMPGMSGVQLLREVKKLHPCCQVILTTGMLEERVAREAEEAGAAALLRKPFDMDEMARTVTGLGEPQHVPS